jgi:hypothetical protein
MNKKKLLLVLLALAIVTSLSAGTLAIYSKSVTAVDNKVQAKKFAFTANAAMTYVTEFSLAPKDSWSYTFDVDNYDKTGTAEVALDYTIAVDDKAATEGMSGLQTTLQKQVDGKWVDLADVTTGVISKMDDGIGLEGTSGSGASQASSESTSTYKVTLFWNDKGDNEVQTKQGIDAASNDLKVTVTASQNTVDANISNTSGKTNSGEAPQKTN